MDFFGERCGSKSAVTGIQLRGPRPAALAVNRSSAGVNKALARSRDRPDPVVVYLRSPKVIHVQPEEFMRMVQLLTGTRPASTAGSLDSIVASPPTSSDDSGYGDGSCTSR